MPENMMGKKNMYLLLPAIAFFSLVTGIVVRGKHEEGHQRSKLRTVNYLLELARSQSAPTKESETRLRSVLRSGASVERIWVDDYLWGTGVEDTFVIFRGEKKFFGIRFNDRQRQPDSVDVYDTEELN